MNKTTCQNRGMIFAILFCGMFWAIAMWALL